MYTEIDEKSSFKGKTNQEHISLRNGYLLWVANYINYLKIIWVENLFFRRMQFLKKTWKCFKWYQVIHDI